MVGARQFQGYIHWNPKFSLELPRPSANCRVRSDFAIALIVSPTGLRIVHKYVRLELDMPHKLRLDTALTQKGFVESRNKAQALIMAGKVRVNGQVVTKAGMQISDTAMIEVEAKPPFVSRGGQKLAAALEAFRLDPKGAICADVGASTGGFTDVLLQHGAAKVYAIDVGYGQLAWELRQDQRVIVMERTNARYVNALPELVDWVTIDASFISLKLILPVVKQWLAGSALIIALIKPQFEAGKGQVGKGGVIRKRSVHYQVLEEVLNFAVEIGFCPLGLIASPITGPAGNYEFLLHLGWNTGAAAIEIASLIEQGLAALDRS